MTADQIIVRAIAACALVGLGGVVAKWGFHVRDRRARS